MLQGPHALMGKPQGIHWSPSLFQKPAVSQINLQVTFPVACSVYLRHARSDMNTTETATMFNKTHLKLVWVPSLAADSCVRKKDLFGNAVAKGNHIAVLQSLKDNLYGSHKGS